VLTFDGELPLFAVDDLPIIGLQIHGECVQLPPTDAFCCPVESGLREGEQDRLVLWQGRWVGSRICLAW